MSELAKALCAVMSRVRYVPETGKNQFHRYSYASDEDLLTVLQPAMADAGLAMVPTHVDQRTVEHTPDGKGKAQWRTEVLVTYALLHTSGESATIQAPGCGLDGEDKGVYKAMTGALKYALRHTFLVPTGEDAERHEAPRQPRREPPSGGAKSGPALERLAADRRESPPPSSQRPTSGGDEAAPASGGGQRWTADQARAFFGSLARLVPPIPREEYESRLAVWCEQTRGRRPSVMTASERADLLIELTKGEARVAYGEWAARVDAAQGAA